MNMKTRYKIGDIFEVPLINSRKAYVQYIGEDSTMLNSDVIRVFSRRYPITDKLEIFDIVRDEVEFYAHTHSMQLGVDEKLWYMVGNSDDTGDIKAPLFRSAVGLERPEISKDWQVWHPNEPMQYVGELKGENTKADIGSSLPPEWIVKRIETGKYHFKYPDYK